MTMNKNTKNKRFDTIASGLCFLKFDPGIHGMNQKYLFTECMKITVVINSYKPLIGDYWFLWTHIKAIIGQGYPIGWIELKITGFIQILY